MIDEPVHLEKHNPFWKEYFVKEQKRLKETLHVDSSNIQHIGSTAIDDIYAKPIIDIMIGVETFPLSQYLTDKLIYLGYDALGESGVTNRLYFRYRRLQLFNVHVVKKDGQHWNSNLAFRDYLRAYPKEATRYEEVKIKAVKSGKSSLLEYSAAKSMVIKELVSLGLAWRSTK
ncbi:MAG: GrpB family protein [Cyanobacteria bacterium P01_G01_bin.49]